MLIFCAYPVYYYSVHLILNDFNSSFISFQFISFNSSLLNFKKIVNIPVRSSPVQSMVHVLQCPSFVTSSLIADLSNASSSLLKRELSLVIVLRTTPLRFRAFAIAFSSAIGYGIVARVSIVCGKYCDSRSNRTVQCSV